MVIFTSMIYDIAIIGAGCAGWQLIYHGINYGNWSEKSILLIDQNQEPMVFPTWCFWSKEKHPFEFLSSKAWPEIQINDRNHLNKVNIDPYQYYYIKGEDFFDYFQNQFLAENLNIDFKKPIQVQNISLQNNEIYFIEGLVESFYSKKVFSSYSFQKEPYESEIKLHQNFLGWKIKFKEDILNSKSAILMDFRNSHDPIFEFMYLLPFSNNIALVEWTSFYHEDQIEPDYEKKIRSYIDQFFPNRNYEKLEIENGSIPMSNYPHKNKLDNGIVLIGSAAGLIKSSSGYTFNRITKDSRALINGGKRGNSNKRFRYFDTIILRILRDNPQEAIQIFMAMFRNNKPDLIFKFLDEESNFFEEIGLFLSLPPKYLIKSVLKGV